VTITLECISPINGSVYATRETLDFAAANDVVTNAKSAQKVWAERIKLVMAGVAK